MKGTQFAFVVCPADGCAEVFVPHIGAGRKRTFCSRTCFQRSWRLRTYGPPPMVKCAGPGCSAQVVANRLRKYCSRTCLQRACYYANVEAKRAYARAYNREARKRSQYDPVQTAVYYQQRRARKVSADNRRVTKADIRRLYERQDGRCLACGKDARLTVDHLIPLSRGGRHAIGNLAGLCGGCNSSKRDLTWMEFRLDRPRARRVA